MPQTAWFMLWGVHPSWHAFLSSTQERTMVFFKAFSGGTFPTILILGPSLIDSGDITWAWPHLCYLHFHILHFCLLSPTPLQRGALDLFWARLVGGAKGGLLTFQHAIWHGHYHCTLGFILHPPFIDSILPRHPHTCWDPWWVPLLLLSLEAPPIRGQGETFTCKS